MKLAIAGAVYTKDGWANTGISVYHTGISLAPVANWDVYPVTSQLIVGPRLQNGDPTLRPLATALPNRLERNRGTFL